MFQKLEIEGSVIKSYYEDPYSQHAIGCFLNQGSGVRQGYLLLHFYSTLYWKLANSVSLETEIKGIQIGKKNKAFPSHSMIFDIKKKSQGIHTKKPLF